MAATEETAWHAIGLLSSFRDISQDGERSAVLPGCKTVSIGQADKAQRTNRLSDLGDQVLVFKYKGFLHAIDNARSVWDFELVAVGLLSLAMPSFVVSAETGECL